MILSSPLIQTNVNVSSWQEAVKAVGDLLLAQNLITSDYTQDMIDVVHEFGPYMILVPGVAFFHGRPGENVKETSLALITLSQPVYMTEFDNEEIKCAFGFCAQDSKSHISVMAQMAALLQQPEFIDLLTNGHSSKEEILSYINKQGVVA